MISVNVPCGDERSDAHLIEHSWPRQFEPMNYLQLYCPLEENETYHNSIHLQCLQKAKLYDKPRTFGWEMRRDREAAHKKWLLHILLFQSFYSIFHSRHIIHFFRHQVFEMLLHFSQMDSTICWYSFCRVRGARCIDHLNSPADTDGLMVSFDSSAPSVFVKSEQLHALEITFRYE